MKDKENACELWTQAESVRQFFLSGEGTEEEGKMRFQELQTLAGEIGSEDDARRKAPSEAVSWWLVTARRVSWEAFQARFFVPVTVSMTTYPARIGLVGEALRSVLAQTRKPQRVLLWLAEEQFPGGETDLPADLRALCAEQGVTVRWCDDLKPHKKYYYALQEIKDGVVITFDDDLLYPADTIELLTLSFVRHPEAVSATRANLMTLGEGDAFLPYSCWIKETDALVDEPSMSLLATTGAGTLYPAGLLSGRVFDRDLLLRTCPLADDLWLKCHEAVAGIPVTLACRARRLNMTEGSQETSLWQENRASNDIQLRDTIRALEPLENGDTFFSLLRKHCAPDQLGLAEYSLHARWQIDRKNEEIRRIRLEDAREVRRLQGEHREEINRLKEAIAEKNEAIRADQEELHRAKEAIAEKNEAIRANQEEIHRCKESIEEKNEAIRANQEEIHRCKEAIAEKNEAIRANQEELHRAKEAIAEKNAALQELRGQKKESETLLKEKIARNTETIMQLNADIEALKNSTSYRIGQKLVAPAQLLRGKK